MSKQFCDSGESFLASNSSIPRSQTSSRLIIRNCNSKSNQNTNYSEPFTRRKPLSLKLILTSCSVPQNPKDGTKDASSIEAQIETKIQSKLDHIIQKSTKQTIDPNKSHGRISSQNISSSPSSYTVLEGLSYGGWETFCHLSKASMNSHNCKTGMAYKKMSFSKPIKPLGDEFFNPTLQMSPIFDSSISNQESSPSKVTLDLADQGNPAPAKQPRISRSINLKSARSAYNSCIPHNFMSRSKRKMPNL